MMVGRRGLVGAFFFFSSRRRHTRSKRDWSSDVCFPISERLRTEYEVPVEWVAVVDDRVETAPAVAEELAESGELEELGCTAWLSEVHPTATRIERSEEHTSELQSRFDLVCRLLLEKNN